MEITITARSTSKTGKSMWVSFKTTDLNTEITTTDDGTLRTRNEKIYYDEFHGLYKIVEREVEISMTAEDIKKIIDLSVLNGIIKFSSKFSISNKLASSRKKPK